MGRIEVGWLVASQGAPNWPENERQNVKPRLSVPPSFHRLIKPGLFHLANPTRPTDRRDLKVHFQIFIAPLLLFVYYLARNLLIATTDPLSCLSGRRFVVRPNISHCQLKRNDWL